MSDLKPCPFCGNEAKLLVESDGRYRYCVQCVQCKTRTQGTAYRNDIFNVAEWNTRADGWISVEDRLPEPEQIVLAAVNGFDAPVVAHMLWETCNPMIELYYKDFLYWDDVHHDGQDFGELVSHWKPCSEMPTL